jgi:methylmalonyl-CoA mutase
LPPENIMPLHDSPHPETTHSQPLRFVTASSLFDGHDVSINIMRRILQASGCEVIHLGHNRSVNEIVSAAIQEDVQAIAISSYQGGHVEFLQYMVDQLAQHDASHIRIFAGGGGVISAEEVATLQDYGVTRIYTPQLGQQLGLKGIIKDMMQRSEQPERPAISLDNADNKPATNTLANLLSALDNRQLDAFSLNQLRQRAGALAGRAPVLGITGTGGAGKSSLTDELILRFRLDQQDRLRIAVLAIDPSRRKTGGALLGDRIRMNAIDHAHIFFRSIATRDAPGELPAAIDDMIAACQLAGFDLVIVETPGIGQGDAAISQLSDCALYVMTAEYGAQSQLEKIDMLDFADLVAINKFDRKGAPDALRDVARQWQRNHECFDRDIESLPVFGTTASRFNDDGVTALYQVLSEHLRAAGLDIGSQTLTPVDVQASSQINSIVPSQRVNYLAEISRCIADYRVKTEGQAEVARRLQHIESTLDMLETDSAARKPVLDLRNKTFSQLRAESRHLLAGWDELQLKYGLPRWQIGEGEQTQTIELFRKTLSGSSIPRIALPRFHDHGDRLRWLQLENVPGSFPYTAGVFALKRDDEDPTRMFAGEGDAHCTNQRFKKLSQHSRFKRLSTAFDSVTLYGCDPDERPDIYGKIGNSGVSIATLDDMRELYAGFDLCDPATSVSMTINGPAPCILAMFLNAAIDQCVDRFYSEQGHDPNAAEYQKLQADALKRVRGTVQADILKEDQGQNTCIFSSEFALRMMGDMQQYFIEHEIRHFYSVSISGYHIAEAGANPISQLAFTLANGFTYVEAWLARGMNIDDFAPNLSFFFSNGMDAEYSVIGRVARRIWAIALRERYGANERSQKLKYHIQTSGRSLHAQEMDFNDIRTTLQALIANYDNCNSLHTNAFDEALTTPTQESVRRALAIQLIINREWGLSLNENPNQGAFIIDELSDLVETAVLREFERLSERGGVLGAMESGYQRGKIQDESMLYEQRKHDGSLPIVGVNCFLNNQQPPARAIKLQRSSNALKDRQIERLRAFKSRHRDKAADALDRVKQAALSGGNIFDELMQAVQVCTLGQISAALYDVGGRYRRNM